MIHLLLSAAMALCLVSDPENPFPANEVRVASGNAPISDNRLLGTWISDKEKTMNYWRMKQGLSQEKQAKVGKLFGKLKLEFQKDTVRTEYEGRSDIEPYKVIAFDNESVVISGKDFNGSKLTQIHFDQDGYYIQIGYNIEFFKRIQSPQKK